MPTPFSYGINRGEIALRIARFIGLVGFLGGAAALTAFTWLGPRPVNREQWEMLIHAMRAIFFPCMFGGIVVLIIVGGIMWWRRRFALNRQVWFRVMMGLIIVFVPALHLFARSSMLTMRAAVEMNDLHRASIMWERLAWAYLLATIVFVIVAAIGIAKPGSTQNNIET
jgi:hypothetical protein